MFIETGPKESEASWKASLFTIDASRFEACELMVGRVLSGGLEMVVLEVEVARLLLENDGAFLKESAMFIFLCGPAGLLEGKSCFSRSDLGPLEGACRGSWVALFNMAVSRCARGNRRLCPWRLLLGRWKMLGCNGTTRSRARLEMPAVIQGDGQSMLANWVVVDDLV